MRKLLLVAIVLFCAAPASGSPLRLVGGAKDAVQVEIGAGAFQVDCSYAFRGGDGFAQPAYRRLPAIVWVKPYVCRRLNQLWRQKTVGETELPLTARALLVFTHETLHVSPFAGARDEALTECEALQSVARVARRLGVSEDLAKRLGRAAVSHHLALVGHHPHYGHPECRAGGALDLGSGLDWPNP